MHAVNAGVRLLVKLAVGFASTVFVDKLVAKNATNAAHTSVLRVSRWGASVISARPILRDAFTTDLLPVNACAQQVTERMSEMGGRYFK